MIPTALPELAKARRLKRKIAETFAKGGCVQVVTHLKITTYLPQHAEMFKFDRFSAYVTRGKHLDCIDFATIRFGLPR